MRIKSLTAAASALAMVIAPVAASAANPAQSLSVAGSVRASADQDDASMMAGGGLVIGLVLAAIFAAALVLPDALDDGPDSP